MMEKLFVPNQELNDVALAEVMANCYQPNEPEGALGRLEEIVFKLAGHQGSGEPNIRQPAAFVFVGDHGVVTGEDAEDFFDFQLTQTRQRVAALCAQHSAATKIANFSQMPIKVIDIAAIDDLSGVEGIDPKKVASGTERFIEQASMTEAQLMQALMTGAEIAEQANISGVDLFVSGNIGMGSELSALAMVSVLSGKSPEELLSHGKQRLMSSERRKVALIEQALQFHKENLTSPLKVLQHLGGMETAALCGAYIRCSQLGLTMVVDGFMSSVAAWIADLVSRNDQLANCQSDSDMMMLGKYSVPETLFCICGTCPRLVEWCLFANQTELYAHKLVLEILAVDPLLPFDIKGEQAIGSSLVVPLIQQACLAYSALPKVAVETESIENNEACFFAG